MKTTNSTESSLRHVALCLALGLGLTAGTALAAPANDNFANAIDLTGAGVGQTGNVTTGNQTGTNSVAATVEAGEPAIFTATKTVWFKWTSPGDGTFTFGTLGSTNAGATEWDTMIGIYTGTAVNALTPLGDTPKDTVVPESMTVAVTLGTTYYIQLAGYQDEEAANILLNWNATVNQADILTFGPGASVGALVANAANIALTVPFGTDLSTLAPTFTLSPGATCTVDGNPVVSGATVDFSSGPKDYVVTSQDSSLVNTYTVTITVAPPPVDGTWNVNANGDWYTATNWVGDTVAGGTGATATFPNIITAARAVNLDAAVTVGKIVFTDTSHDLTISGANPLTLDAATGSSEVSVSGGAGRALILSSDIVNGDGLLKSGNGILRLSDDGYSFPSISVTAGTLDFSSASNDSVNRTLGGGNYTGTIDIASGTTFQFYRNSGNQEFSGVISGAGTVKLGHKGTYTLSGANTYSGKTIIHGEYNGNTATLNVSSFNSIVSGSIETGMGTVATPVTTSSLGKPTTEANGTVDVGRTAMQASAALNYTGLGETTDRVINLVSSGNSQRKGVNNLGSGTLTFTSPWIGPSGVNNNTIPITTNADMILTGSVPDNFVALEKRGNAKLSLSGPCTIYNNVNIYAGTLEVDSEINDGGVYGGAITTGSGNGGTNFITVPAGTPIAVGMSIVHTRLAPGTTIVAITDINANPIVAQVSSNSDTTARTETGYIGFKGALGIIPPAADKLRWFGNATLKYDGPDNSTNRSFTIDNGFTSTWEIIGGSTLEVSGATTNTTGKLTKTGAGTLVFSGTLLNDGITTVSSGKLFIDGDSSGANGAVSVASDATLGGIGIIGGDTTIDDTGKLEFGLSTVPGSHDKLDIATGKALTFSGDAVLTITSSGGASTGLYTLLTADGGISGAPTFTVNLPSGWTADAPQIVGNDLQINITSTGVVSTPYETWATGGELFNEDANGDGVKNGLAFLLGAANPSENAIGRLPTVTEIGGSLVMTFNCLPVAARGTATLKVAHSNALTAWTSTVDVVPDANDAVPDNNVTFVVGAGPAGPPALNTVTATIGSGAAAAGKLFGRLEATEP